MNQLDEARKLLEVLRGVVASGQPTTYSGAAQLLGRPANNTVATGALCNLLDGAACLADIPSLALVWVRAAGYGFNQDAWVKEYGNGSERELIFQRSLQYQFQEQDFKAIAAELDRLDNSGRRSNEAVWRFIWSNTVQKNSI